MFMYMYICALSMHVSMYVRIHTCSIYAHMYNCIYVYMYVGIYMCICVYV